MIFLNMTHDANITYSLLKNPLMSVCQRIALYTVCLIQDNKIADDSSGLSSYDHKQATAQY
jgi:hypothetical protein